MPVEIHQGPEMREHPGQELKALRVVLEMNAEFYDPVPGRGAVDGLTHNLQVGTRAEKHIREHPELFSDYTELDLVVMAVTHDALRPLSNVYHARLAGLTMKGRLPEPLPTVLANHSEFQVDIIRSTHGAERHRKKPWYPLAKQLEVWDAASFDPDYPTEPLDHFWPMIEEVYLRPPQPRVVFKRKS